MMNTYLWDVVRDVCLCCWHCWVWPVTALAQALSAFSPCTGHGRPLCQTNETQCRSASHEEFACCSRIGRCLKFVTCALRNCVMGLVWTQDIQCMMQVILVTNALKTIDIICTEHPQRRKEKILHISRYISICNICLHSIINSLSILMYIIVAIPVDTYIYIYTYIHICCNHQYDISIYYDIYIYIYIFYIHIWPVLKLR